MKQAARTIGERLGQFLKSFNPRAEFLTSEKHLRASNIILAMTVAMLLLVFGARFLADLLGHG